MLTAPAQGRAMDLHAVNLTVVALGFFAMMAALLLRRWLWLILLPPGMSLLVYVILNTIAQRH